MRIIGWLVLPALVFLVLSRLGAMPRLPRPLRAFFRWFGRVGNLTLAIYCGAVALWGISGFRQPNLEPHEAALLAVLVTGMVLLALSFWRAASRTMRER
ncbi:MAG: hypothetical protein RMM58_01040 [Chloroflexota bacterium]|nr:hypothetical protein [Dehalococcoidia bacterium]MDW8252444.1 hypothetical protein [Chloroflexota bacterium]